MIITIIVLSLISSIAITYIIYLIYIIKNCKKMVDDFKKDCNELFELLKEKDNHLELLKISIFISGLMISANKEEYEKFTFFYNKLHFLGIPQEILNDSDKLTEFYDDCINNKFILEQGTKPFTYKFIRR